MNGVAAEVTRHVQVCYCCYQKDAWKGTGRRKKTLLSLSSFFSFLKTRHLRDRAGDYFCLFWETMLVSLDSNQPGSREASSRVRAWISEATWAWEPRTTAAGTCARTAQPVSPRARRPRCPPGGQFGACSPPLSSVPRGKSIQGRGGGNLPEGPLRTQCQPETAADVEQQHQGPTVPSCPSSSSPTTERTVKRPRVGGRPTRTKELAAGKTTCALSNSSQNNPFPRVSH